MSQEVLIAQVAVVSTNDVRPSEKFGLWKDTLWQLLGRLRSGASGDESFGRKRSRSAHPYQYSRVKNDEEAIRLANQSEYGLSAAVFSRNVPRALGVALQIQSGICHINSSTVHDEAQMPFGGVKGCGYGRFGGEAAIHEFTELRWITIQTAPRDYPF